MQKMWCTSENIEGDLFLLNFGCPYHTLDLGCVIGSACFASSSMRSAQPSSSGKRFWSLHEVISCNLIAAYIFTWNMHYHLFYDFVYMGILIEALANASHQNHTLSTPQIVLNVVGFCVTVATIIFFTAYSKRQLKELQQKENDLVFQ
ncbi:hypothetical protein GmHk_01G002695 [Glycine max]|nr:hypothetical protein GmHk_01G002695 [Glycine max]